MKKIREGKGNEIITLKIKDFTKDKDEPAYDVELYINGKFDDTYDGVISTRSQPKDIAKNKALLHAINKLRNLLKDHRIK